ncbi:MAG: type 1 glutamine amidotransferase family protein [Pseudomonadota bacterium]
MAETVHLFIFDGLADWEPGFAIAGINDPSHQREPGRYVVRTVSPHGKVITSTGGLRIQPDLALSDLRPDDSALLILAGGAGWDDGKHGDAADLAARFLAQGKPVAAICGATAGLARNGLLDTRKHTSNAPQYLSATGYKGAALYREDAVVSDGNLITASSMAPLDFARAIFARLDLYEPAVLDAWYGLFSTRRPEYFAALVAASD